MARKRSKRNTRRYTAPRDTIVYRYRPTVRAQSVSLSPLVNLYEDRRVYHPAGPFFRPVSAFVKSATLKKVPMRTTIGKVRYFNTAFPAFSDPDKVFVCVRRKVRREVLHAVFGKLSGFGGRGRKTAVSDVRC